MRPHEVSKTLSINNVRVAIMALSRPLAAITKSLLQNEGLLKQREKEVQNLSYSKLYLAPRKYKKRSSY